MFKKTVIAAALAAVTGSAMAEVSVSGRVEQGFADEDNTNVGWTGFSDNQINFKATEDLGNGMTAFAQISFDADNNVADGATGGNDDLDQKVGLKGGFGTVVLGRFEPFTEGVMAATMSTMGTNEGELGANTGRTSNGIAYVSPTVSGFHVAAGGYAAGTSADKMDATDILAAYSNGPLTVMAAQQKTNSGIVTGANEMTVTSFAVKYSMGDLSVAALQMNHDDEAGTAGNDSDDTMFRLDYKMGANKITLQHASDENNGAADEDTTVIELSHALSKRTAVYIGGADSDDAAKENTYFGIQHTF